LPCGYFRPDSLQAYTPESKGLGYIMTIIAQRFMQHLINN